VTGMGRTTGNRKLKSPVITVIGEGITEQYYFSHIRDLYVDGYTIKPYYFGTTSLKEMDRKISEVLEGDGIAVCVFDVDVSHRVDAEKKKLMHLLKKYSKKKNVIFCDSLPSVEYWFLIHYENTNKHFNNSKDVERKLKKYIVKYEKSTQFLEKELWVAELCANNKLDAAIERAEFFGDQSPSYSNIYKAFNLFNK